MRRLTTLTAALAVAAMFTLMGLTGTALADEDDPVDPKVHKEDDKHQYINLGLIGDMGIYCGLLPRETGDISIPDGSRDGFITLVPSIPTNIPGMRPGDLCLGGSAGEYDPADNHGRWDVWIHDYVWNGCDAYTIPAQDGLCPVQPAMGLVSVEGITELTLETAFGTDWTVELKAAGFARTETSYQLSDIAPAPGSDANNCIPLNGDSEAGPRACLQQSGPHFVHRLSNFFGFCGQGSIDSGSGMVDPFDVSSGPDSNQATNVQVSKTVFTDGLLYYHLDCPLLDSIPATARPFYDLASSLVRTVACPIPATHIAVYCSFPLQVGFYGCYGDEFETNFPVTNAVILPVSALVGEIGWTHEPTDTCKDYPYQDDWRHVWPGENLVLKGLQPSACAAAVYVATAISYAAAECGNPFVECTFMGWGFTSNEYGYYYDSRMGDFRQAPYPVAYEQTMECFVEDGCNGVSVETAAALPLPLAGDMASADVECGNSVIVSSTADSLTPIDTDGPETTPDSADYKCILSFHVVDGLTPYFGVAACS